MNELEYREAIKAYTDVDGLVAHKKLAHPNERGSSGNGLLYTSIHLISLHQNGWITEEDKKKFSNTVDACKVERNGWLLNRNPLSTILNSHDDYTGVAAALHICKMPFHAAAMLRDFKERKFILDNEYPYNPRTFRAGLWRMPSFVAHIYNCAGYAPPLFHKKFLEMNLKISATFASQASDDSWLLGYLKAMSYKSKASDYFINKLKTTFQDKGQGIVSRVLDEDPTHPVGLAFKLI